MLNKETIVLEVDGKEEEWVFDEPETSIVTDSPFSHQSHSHSKSNHLNKAIAVVGIPLAAHGVFDLPHIQNAAAHDLTNDEKGSESVVSQQSRFQTPQLIDSSIRNAPEANNSTDLYTYYDQKTMTLIATEVATNDAQNKTDNSTNYSGTDLINAALENNGIETLKDTKDADGAFQALRNSHDWVELHVAGNNTQSIPEGALIVYPTNKTNQGTLGMFYGFHDGMQQPLVYESQHVETFASLTNKFKDTQAHIYVLKADREQDQQNTQINSTQTNTEQNQQPSGNTTSSEQNTQQTPPPEQTPTIDQRQQLIEQWKNITDLGSTPQEWETNFARVSIALNPNNLAIAEYEFAQIYYEGGVDELNPESDTLGFKHFNFWGIKGEGNDGDGLYDTYEYENGIKTPTKARFAHYKTLADGFAAHQELLTSDRYKNAFDQKTIEDVARVVNDDGYSTTDTKDYVDGLMAKWNRHKAAFEKQLEILQNTPGTTQPEQTQNQQSQTVEYTVQPGDTLKDIARKYGVSLQTIIQYNHLGNPDLIHPNDQIVIPGISSENSDNQNTTSEQTQTESSEQGTTPEDFAQAAEKIYNAYMATSGGFTYESMVNNKIFAEKLKEQGFSDAQVNIILARQSKAEVSEDQRGPGVECLGFIGMVTAAVTGDENALLQGFGSAAAVAQRDEFTVGNVVFKRMPSNYVPQRGDIAVKPGTPANEAGHIIMVKQMKYGKIDGIESNEFGNDQVTDHVLHAGFVIFHIVGTSQ